LVPVKRAGVQAHDQGLIMVELGGGWRVLLMGKTQNEGEQTYFDQSAFTLGNSKKLIVMDKRTK